MINNSLFSKHSRGWAWADLYDILYKGQESEKISALLKISLGVNQVEVLLSEMIFNLFSSSPALTVRDMCLKL